MFTRIHRPLAALLGLAALIVGAIAGGGLAAPSFATSTTPCVAGTTLVSPQLVRQTFCTPGVTWTVPDGITSINMQAFGAHGGNIYETDGTTLKKNGQRGSYVSASVAVTPGQQLTIAVGQMGGAAVGPTSGAGGVGLHPGATAVNVASGHYGAGGGGGSSGVTASGPVTLIEAPGGDGTSAGVSGDASTAAGGDKTANDSPIPTSDQTNWRNGDGMVIFEYIPTTTTTVSSSANPSVYGQPLTFTATVEVNSPATVDPTNQGTVDFQFSRNGGTTWVAIASCQGVAISGGQAACTPPSVASAHAGSAYGIRAIYSGGTDATYSYAGSTSAPITQTINKVGVDMGLTSSANPAVYGQPITFTATVESQQTINPTADPIAANVGTVTFSLLTDDGSSTLATYCTGVALTAGTGGNAGSDVATCTLTTAQLADLHVSDSPFYISAAYSGSDDYNAGNGNMDTPDHGQVVNPADTSVSLSSNANPSVYGQPFTITATVTADSPSTINPTGGTVVFFIDGNPVACSESYVGPDYNVTDLAGNTASCTVEYPWVLEDFHVGNHTVTAQFIDTSGDYNDSPVASLTQVINPAATTTTATAAYYNYVSGGVASITAWVTSNDPSTVDPWDVGTVSFYNGSTWLCTVPLEYGSATCTKMIDPSSVAPHTLRAVYNADGGNHDYLPSTGYTDVVPHLASPTISSIVHAYGTTNTAWLLGGGGFSGASSVTVCGVSVPFTVVNDNQMLVGVPSVNAPKLCVITVVAAGGVGSTPGTVTVVPVPQPGAPVVIIPTGPGTPSTPTPTPPACGTTTDLSLSGRWTLVAWPGADGMSVADALSGGDCGNDVTSSIAVIWGFDAATQSYLAYFPGATNVPGANDLTMLTRGLGYWVALVNPGTAVTWTIVTG